MSAFAGCTALESIAIPSGVTSIGTYAFYHCEKLTEIALPSVLTTIGNKAFGYCKGLTSVVIPKSVTSVGEYIFEYCNYSLTINCECKKADATGWNKNWNAGSSGYTLKVVWEYVA